MRSFGGFADECGDSFADHSCLKLGSPAIGRQGRLLRLSLFAVMMIGSSRSCSDTWRRLVSTLA